MRSAPNGFLGVSLSMNVLNSKVMSGVIFRAVMITRFGKSFDVACVICIIKVVFLILE